MNPTSFEFKVRADGSYEFRLFYVDASYDEAKAALALIAQRKDITLVFDGNLRGIAQLATEQGVVLPS